MWESAAAALTYKIAVQTFHSEFYSMITVNPLCLLFENGSTALSLENKMDERYVVRLRSTNSTAYNYCMDDIILEPHEKRNLEISID